MPDNEEEGSCKLPYDCRRACEKHGLVRCREVECMTGEDTGAHERDRAPEFYGGSEAWEQRT